MADFTWTSETDWSNAQDSNDIKVDGGSFGLASVIPDSGVYLDDYADNKLSNRDDYSTTPLSPESLEPDTSDYSNPSRVDWNVGAGSPTATGEQLELSNAEYVWGTLPEVDVTIEYDFTFVGSLSKNQYDTVLATGTSQRSGEFNLEEGYYLEIDSDGSGIRLFSGSSGGFTELIAALGLGISADQTVTIRLENNYDSGADEHNFELFIDDTSYGTATDSTYSASQIQYTSFVFRGTGSGDTTTRDNLRVY